MSSIIAKYLKELRGHTASGGTYAYRGQGNAKWGVESAAFRRLKNSDGNPPTDRRFISYHKEQILEPARMNGYGLKSGQELSDLELLAEMQHYGAATCLIDFTRDFLVALWFACQICKDEKAAEQDGKVFILNTNDAQIFRSLEQKDMKGKIEAILDFQTRVEEDGVEEIAPSKQPPLYWHWSPHYMNQRVLKQNSLFVFGKPRINTTHLREILITSKDKRKMLEELRILGITRESLFKDAPGFAASHSHNEPISPISGLPESYYEAGNRAYQRNDIEMAIKLYDKAIAEKPSYAEAYYNRGFAKSDLGNHADAIEDYNKAIEYRDDDADAYNSRGVEKSHLGDHLGALKDYDKAIDLDSNCVEAYQNRGVENSRLRKYSAAIEDYKKAIEIKPDHASAHYNLGLMESHRGNHSSAIEHYSKAIEIKPDHAFAYYHRGNAKHVQGNYQSAIIDYSKTIELMPNAAWAYYSRGNAKLALNDYQGAMADYKKAIAIMPNYAPAHYNLGIVYLKLLDYGKARQSFQLAKEFAEQSNNSELVQKAEKRLSELGTPGDDELEETRE